MNEKGIISLLDKVANLKNAQITKLPVIPNTKGTYTAQYCFNTGLLHGHVIVLRVYPIDTYNKTKLVGVYYFRPNSENLRNLNSRNHRLSFETNEQLLMYLFKTIGTLEPNLAMTKQFIHNVEKLAKDKENPWAVLEDTIYKLSGKKINMQELVEKEENAPRYAYYSRFRNSIIPDEALEYSRKLLNFIENFN
ncbi:hypothetical protein KY334_01550 [Candidatus Woesearchaeota archaeon]|nr:hypothetical protein [Candidatus Woesearchaeota archaeon]